MPQIYDNIVHLSYHYSKEKRALNGRKNNEITTRIIGCLCHVSRLAHNILETCIPSSEKVNHIIIKLVAVYLINIILDTSAQNHTLKPTKNCRKSDPSNRTDNGPASSSTVSKSGSRLAGVLSLKSIPRYLLIRSVLLFVK